MTNNVDQSGIAGYLYTKTSITIKYTNGSMYRYDESEVLTKNQIQEMIKLAKAGSGLNSYLNKHPDIKRYGFIDETLSSASFKAY